VTNVRWGLKIPFLKDIISEFEILIGILELYSNNLENLKATSHLL